MNLLWCLPGAVGGSEEYLVRQLIGLHEVAPEIAHHAWPCCPGSPPPTRGGRRPRARRRLARRPPPQPPSAGRGHVAARRARPASDVVHHGGGTVPPRSPRPIVLTIHDLQYRTFPQYLTALKRRYLSVGVPRSVRRAAVVDGAERLRAGNRRRRLRRRRRARRRRAARRRSAGRPGPTRPTLRRRYHLGGTALRRVPGHHPPAQEPPVAARAAGAVRGPTRTSCWCCSAAPVPPTPTWRRRSVTEASAPA